MKLYLEITQDDLALPVLICDSAKELRRIVGLKKNNLASQICKGNQGVFKYPRFISVEVEDD